MSGKEPTWDGAYLFTTLARSSLYMRKVQHRQGSWWIPLEGNLTAAISVSREIIFLFLLLQPLLWLRPGPLELPKGSQPCSQSDSRSTWQTRTRSTFLWSCCFGWVTFWLRNLQWLLIAWHIKLASARNLGLQQGGRTRWGNDISIAWTRAAV